MSTFSLGTSTSTCPFSWGTVALGGFGLFPPLLGSIHPQLALCGVFLTSPPPSGSGLRVVCTLSRGCYTRSPAVVLGRRCGVFSPLRVCGRVCVFPPLFPRVGGSVPSRRAVGVVAWGWCFPPPPPLCRASSSSAGVWVVSPPFWFLPGGVSPPAPPLCRASSLSAGGCGSCPPPLCVSLRRGVWVVSPPFFVFVGGVVSSSPCPLCRASLLSLGGVGRVPPLLFKTQVELTWWRSRRGSGSCPPPGSTSPSRSRSASR